jgi:Tfp pilus assembly protein PilO
MDNVALGIQIIVICLVPIVGYFGSQVINLMGKTRELESDFRHLKGNYAQAFDAITEEMQEMRTDIKELLRRSYREEGRKEADPA